MRNNYSNAFYLEKVAFAPTFYFRIRTLLVLRKIRVNIPFITLTMLINTGFYKKICSYDFVRLA